MAVNRALLVGIDEYDQFSSLEGCVNDVNAVLPLLARHHDDTVNFACQVRTGSGDGPPVNRDALLTDVGALFAAGADVALLYFAGHGASHGSDDVSLCTADGTEQTPGVKLSEVLTEAAKSTVGTIIIILDCCFSGSAGGVPQLASPGSFLRPGLAILAASRGDQTAAETSDRRGAFSTFLCGALEDGAADVLGKVTLAGLYAYLDECFGPWEQRPVFKANVERLSALRQCRPSVPLSILQRLPTLFPTAEYEYPLDRSYEPTEDPPHPENERIFDELQKARSAKLVEPVDAEHMYYAAMDTKSCRLTALGRLYWHMADKDLL